MGLFDGIGGSLAGIGTSAATGNYVGAAIGAVGLGISLFGGNKQAEDAKRAHEVQLQIAGQEQNIQEKKAEAMILQSRRSQMEIFRQAQRARAQATAAAVNQGAAQGSGLQGGIAQVTASENTSLTNNQQNLSIGQNIFALNSDISKKKLQLSDIQSSIAADQGLSALGGSIAKSGDPFGRLFSQLGAGGQIGTFSGGGNDGMAPTWT